MKKTYLILSIFLGMTASLFSQINKEQFHYLESQIPKEKVVLQTNTNTLLAGEYLYYQAMCLNAHSNSLSGISKIVYTELVGANENVVIRQKLKTEKNITNGAFFIPSSVKTGHYKLIAYTNWSLNNNVNAYHEKDIYIINPFSSEQQFNNSDVINSNTAEISKTDTLSTAINNQILITTDKNTYQSREKVLIKLEKNTFNPYNGNYSLSVRKLDSIELVHTSENQNKKPTNTNTYYLPELRGDIITGKITATDGKTSVSYKQISLSIPGSDFVFKNVSTNENGEFYFVLSENYKPSDVILQVQESVDSQYTISINEERFNAYGNLEFSNLKLNSNIANWLKNRSINNQIENAYFSVKNDSIILNSPNETFYNALATTYHLDDYTRFPTVKETFIEIISTASLSKKGDDYIFQVPDLANLHFNNTLKDVAPLVLIDGILIQDNQIVADYKANNIDHISTVTGHYIYGSKIYNGLISITTKNEDFSLSDNNGTIKKVQLLNPLPDKVNYQPDYSTNKNNRIPDYRTQLLWKPNLILENNLPKEIMFFTSDSKGVYEVVLEGYSTKGNYIKASNYFMID